MKKLLFLLAFVLPASSTVFAEEVEIDGLWYSLSETTAEVIKYKNSNKYTGDIIIPEVVSYNETDYSVTSIGKEAFYSCWDMTSVTIPYSVTTIGELAFSHCNGLTSVTIPNSVTGIEFSAFFDCKGLTSITIPSSVTSIKSAAFSACNRLSTIIVDDGNTMYDSRNNCNAIIETTSNKLIAGCKNTTIPNNVTTIGTYAFDFDSSISIKLPNSVTSIEERAFEGFDGLTAIVIPNSVTSIGCQAFAGCYNLTDIVVEEGNTMYDSRNNCNAIIETSSNTLIVGCQNTIIPNSVTTIGSGAFESCTHLTSITIPNSVTSIENSAFNGCYGLTSIKIPNSVISIGTHAFSTCMGLTTIVVEEGNSVYDSRNNCNAIIETSSNTLILGCQNSIIPNTVTTIGNDAFKYCNGLISVTIPNSVTSIGKDFFSWCSFLTDVYCFAESVPTTDANAFGGSTPISNITLHVPAASVDTYQAAEPWNGFKKIVALSTIDVSNQKIGLDGTTTVEIGLNNSETNFVAFQMDLTLPEGVSIDKTGCSLSSRITDENQELTVGKLESGDYRITSTSLSLTPISGNEGTLLTLKLTAAEDFEGGQATISNIRFSTSNSVKVVMSDETFDIDILKKYKLRYIVDGQEYLTEEVTETTPLTPADEPTREGYTFGGWSEVPETMPDHDVVITGRFYLFGDVNTDEEVDVVDVVDIARFVVATPSANFREKLADLNKDLTVNIADAVVLVNHIAGDQNFAMAPSIGSYDYNQCKLQLLSNGTNTLSLCLSGDADFTAFQFDMELPENSKITTIKINGQRMSGHQLLYNKVGDNCYRVAVLSLSNAVFKGREGELLNISIDGLATDEISIHDIHFVTKTAIDFTFEDISHCETVTSIDHVQLDEGNSVIFDLQGRKLSKAQRGVNIIRSVGGRMQGKKVFVIK